MITNKKNSISKPKRKKKNGHQVVNEANNK